MNYYILITFGLTICFMLAIFAAIKLLQFRRAFLVPEAGLKLLKQPRAPKELPVTALTRNAHGVAGWKLFLNQ